MTTFLATCRPAAGTAITLLYGHIKIAARRGVQMSVPLVHFGRQSVPEQAAVPEVLSQQSTMPPLVGRADFAGCRACGLPCVRVAVSRAERGIGFRIIPTVH